MDPLAKQLISRLYKTKSLIFPRNGFINGKRFDVLTSIDNLWGIARDSGFLEGIETSSAIEPFPRIVNGIWVETDGLVATCRVDRRGWCCPVVSVVSLHEYVRTDRRGRPTVQWRDHAEKLLGRVAAAQAIRKAFNISALYIPEEVGVGMTVGNRVVFDLDIDAPKVSVEQLGGLKSQFAELNVNVPAFCDYFGVMTVADLPVSRYREAIGMLKRKRATLDVASGRRVCGSNIY